LILIPEIPSFVPDSFAWKGKGFTAGDLLEWLTDADDAEAKRKVYGKDPFFPFFKLDR
jgi:hypothetical protein